MMEKILTYESAYSELAQIAKEIENIDLGSSSQLNGLGVRMIATKIARGK